MSIFLVEVEKYISLDFTVEGRHTKFFDCYIVCGESKFMAHRNILCKLDYFDTVFDGKFTVNELDSKPMCTVSDEYEHMIKFISV